jgi:predicted nucleic acid-binding protein
MATETEERHPVLVDTSSLIAIANTTHRDLFASSVHITTTNVCWHELKHHAGSYTYSPEESRKNYLKTGRERVLEYLSADEMTFSCVTIVPRHHHRLTLP